MNIKISIILGTIMGAILLMTCSSPLRSYSLKEKDIEYLTSPHKSNLLTNGARVKRYRNPSCNDPMNYIPDSIHLDHTSWKTIRINFHWMNSADSSHNLRGNEAKKFIRGLLASAGKDMRENRKLWLPYGNDIPVYSPKIRYQLTPMPGVADDDGIYEHFDDDLCFYVHKGKNKNIGSRKVFEKYGVQKDSVLNIFIMPHHPDSVASKTYTSYGVGVTVKDFIKIAGPKELKIPSWAHRGNFNHEVGHILGLGHAWIRDGCDDTPEYRQQCWSRTKYPPCDKATSNNMMDYNALQQALSPCQIGKIHMIISRLNSIARRYVSPTWCTLNEKKTIVIQDAVSWKGAKDLEGNLIVEEGGILSISCRISMPPKGKIILKPGGRLQLLDAYIHNACGKKWDGIIVEQQGKLKGEIQMTKGTVLKNHILAID